MKYHSFIFLLLGFSVLWFFSSLVSFSFAGQLIYSTYLGGGDYDHGYGIAVDGSGNAYITGFTESNDFPTTPGVFSSIFDGGIYDVFVTKLNANGTALVYSTFLGGESYDQGFGIAIDSSGCAYITGRTSSIDFPTTPGAFDTSFNGLYDIFVNKLNASGSTLIYSTFLGGGSDDFAFSIAIDGSWNTYITGYTWSTDFPTTPNAFDTSFYSGADVFVTKLNSSGTMLDYSTYLGGVIDDYGQSIAVDNLGNAYITGYTYSSDFPTTLGAFDTSFNGGSYDVFVSKLNPNGTGLVYSTYLGGGSDDDGHGIVVNSLGNTYITGWTGSSNFPTTSDVFDKILSGHTDAFVTELNPSGTTLVYSTFLGGGSNDNGYGISIDSSGNTYIIGFTNSSTDFPITLGALDTSYNGNGDIFISKLNFNGTILLYSTYLGGESWDYGIGIAIDNSRNTYITGYTRSSTYFPTTPGAFDTLFNGGFSDAFVTKISLMPYFSYGEFTISSDTNYWYFEKYGDGIGPGTLLLDTTYGFVAIYQSPGEKAKLSQVFSVPSSGWYTAQAKVWTTISDSSKQQKVYLYLQELDTTNAVVATGTQLIQSGSGYFGSAWNPKDLEISFYTQGTKLAVQLVTINPANSGESGSLCIDYIRVTAGVSEPLNEITLTNPSFDNGTIGWILEPYGTAPTAGIWTTAYSNLILAQVGGQKGQASQLFSLPSTGQNVYASAWVYSDVATMSSTQKIYLSLYDYSFGYSQVIDSGNMILQPGKWTPRQWQQLQLVFPASTNNNSVQLVGINPVSNSWAGLYFDEVELKQ
jgi:hypothetical protein